MESNLLSGRLLTLLCLLTLPLLAHAGVYKWVDANGQTHFGDRPPAQAASSEVEINAAPPRMDPSAEARHQNVTRFLDEQQREREKQQAAEQKIRQQSQKQEELCQKLQARLKYMASVSTFYDLNAQGGRMFVSESENRAIRERFRQKVAKACDR